MRLNYASDLKYKIFLVNNNNNNMKNDPGLVTFHFRQPYLSYDPRGATLSSDFRQCQKILKNLVRW